MALMSFALTAAILLLDHFGVELNPIVGMLAYTLFPALLFLYLFLIPVGMYLEWRRRRKRGEEELRYPTFDFNIKSQRIQLYVFILGTSLVGLLITAVSYRAFVFAKSVEFCSEICHQVMEPEVTTYKDSPHSRVPCVECHVGSGAAWYVRSKLSGMYQVYSTLFDKYPRPIKAPVKDLRPASETCEECHWPAKFIGERAKNYEYFESDEKNTKSEIPMLMRVGGGVKPTGIHWHVDPDHTVKYIATDEARQEIPYVEVVEKDGTVTKFMDESAEVDEGKLATMEKRTMDCIDCHNRPTHIFHSPNKALNEALAEGEISPSIPFIKKVGLRVLGKEYLSREAALKDIQKTVMKFYDEKYADWLANAQNKAQLEKAISSIKHIYSANNFEHMKSNWKVYPDNIGHFEFKGCFRCHDGNHVADSGKRIGKDCNTCHHFATKPLAESGVIEEFKHPGDVGDAYESMPCSDCHSAGN